ncbi:purine and uridine phosphorylase [Aspergillus novofumigatus IBT 16806]|uniref:Purine and uridine phosphorylase n=1 Tax=Aspergillus novofumigatus (strain IBT 16806) TaxID=1392255 RepID=A0A2I1BUP9_ASPN1|nr:purine and uridine phosphorylase [Aspergillus novofumigatus IBT 16806]PKX89105.1 purine and uridine phosphorylase [Aspergillus novofumigatus IBT 16806]
MWSLFSRYLSQRTSKYQEQSSRDLYETHSQSLGYRRLGKMKIDCSFMPSSKWGTLGYDPSQPAWVLYLQLQFSQPADCTLKSANIELSFQKLQSVGRSKLGPVLTEYFGPKSSGLHRRVEWVVREAKPPYQTILHHDQVRVGLVISHDTEPFFITVRIEGQLEETYGGMLRFGRSVDDSIRCLSVHVSPPANFETSVEEIAKRLNDEMTNMILGHCSSETTSHNRTSWDAHLPVHEEPMKGPRLEGRKTESLRKVCADANKGPDDYTIGWICALPLEMAAASAMLDNVHTNVHTTLPTHPNDHNSYVLGSIGAHNIVIACLPDGVYGTTSAAIVASQMQATFKSIRFSLLVGIGGGVPGGDNDIRLGDVVVSKPSGTLGGVVQYDYGKTTANGQFLQTGALNKPPQALLTMVARMEAEYMVNRDRLSRCLADMAKKHPEMQEFTHRGQEEDRLFSADYDHPASALTCEACDPGKCILRKPRNIDTPVVHYGLIASGNQVMKHGLTRDRLAKEFGIICFEMEAAGLMDNFPCLVIRGICDYADSHKNKTWQKYAAAVAAAYAKDFLVMTPARQVDITPKVVGL